MGLSAIRCSAAMDQRRYYVYAMLCQDGDGPGYVKFGRTGRIGDRLCQLRTNCPIPARFFAIMQVLDYEISVRTEKRLHDQFADRRTTGEWYRFDFCSVDDKRAFNDGCREAFKHTMQDVKGWTKISVAQLDAYHAERRKRFLQSKKRYKARVAAEIKAERARRMAWRELAEYR